MKYLYFQGGFGGSSSFGGGLSSYGGSLGSFGGGGLSSYGAGGLGGYGGKTLKIKTLIFCHFLMMADFF